MASVTKRALKLFRRLAGDRSAPEEWVRAQVNRRRLRQQGYLIRTDACVVRGRSDKRFGVYAFGGCDLESIVPSGRYLRMPDRPLTAVAHVGDISTSRSDFVVQALDNRPSMDAVAETIERLGLDRDHFSAELMEPTFRVPHHPELGEFPKHVVVMSIGPDMVRSMYRHREHGFLFDPGGFWLGADLKNVLGDMDTVKWFARNFQKLGRIGIEDAMANFERIITEVRRNVGATVVMANALVVDPGITTFDYMLSHSPIPARRREFLLGLVDLSQKLDFPILDMDTIVKRDGVTGMADFVHYTAPQKSAIGEQLACLLDEIGALPV